MKLWIGVWGLGFYQLSYYNETLDCHCSCALDILRPILQSIHDIYSPVPVFRIDSTVYSLTEFIYKLSVTDELQPASSE